MIRKLRSSSSRFAKELLHNMCIRVLQRRGIASRLSRYVDERLEETELESWLNETKEQVLQDGKESLVRSFADYGEYDQEVSSFVDFEKGSRPVVSNVDLETQKVDDFESYLRRKASKAALKPPSTPKLMKLHKKGLDVLPKALRATVDALQPTSVPAERAFSRARHARRSCQESMNDERYTSYLLLKDFYLKTEPWEEFKATHPMSAECQLQFNAK